MRRPRHPVVAGLFGDALLLASVGGAAEQHVAHNNCARGDNACHRTVRETFAPRLTEIRNNETLENSRHRQEERILGQVRSECRFDDRVEQRKKTQ